jgi:hypothetical protein
VSDSGKEERWEGPELEAHREAAMAVVAASVLAVTTSLRRPEWTRGHRGEAGTLAPSAPFKPGAAVRVGGEGGHIWGVPCGGKEGGPIPACGWCPGRQWPAARLG